MRNVRHEQKKSAPTSSCLIQPQHPVDNQSSNKDPQKFDRIEVLPSKDDPKSTENEFDDLEATLMEDLGLTIPPHS